MTCSIVTLRYEDVVIHTALQRLVKRYWCTHEFLFDLAQSVKARLELKMVVTRALSDSGDDGNVVAFGADVVRRRYNGNVDIYDCQRGDGGVLWRAYRFSGRPAIGE